MSIFPTLFNIIAHTPLWVWPLYVLLLTLGVQRTRDAIVPVWRLLILPAIVVFLAILGFLLSGQGTLPALLAGLALGSALGWWIERDGPTRRLPDGKLWLQGEWVTFTQIVVVLVFRYGTSAAAGLNPALHANLAWSLGTVFVATTLSAIFLGRTAARLRLVWQR